MQNANVSGKPKLFLKNLNLEYLLVTNTIGLHDNTVSHEKISEALHSIKQNVFDQIMPNETKKTETTNIRSQIRLKIKGTLCSLLDDSVAEKP